LGNFAKVSYRIFHGNLDKPHRSSEKENRKPT
jgi:hypothetical protein